MIIPCGVLMPTQSTCLGRSVVGMNKMGAEDFFERSICSLDEIAFGSLTDIYVLDATRQTQGHAVAPR